MRIRALTLLAGIPLVAGVTPTVTPVPTGSVHVVVQVAGPDGTAAPGGNVAVWLPGVGNPRTARPPVAPTMSSRNKRFEPRVLVVPVGTPVNFPNLDRIFHNVFSLSERNRFDLGLYRNGASRTQAFESAGLVRVYCNIHPQMVAFVVVADSAHLGLTGADGTVRLDGVPVGKHPVRVWDEKGGEWSGIVDVLASRTTTVSVVLDARGFREQGHTNKHGKEYPPPDDDENRY